MATNLLKTYNQLLDLLYGSEELNKISLRRVFNRDIAENISFSFRNRPIKPTKAEGENEMDRFFKHLTTVITDEKTRKREFETERSIRLHWIKHHIEERKKEKMLVFTVESENRVYVLDKEERYVIIFEPLRKENSFFMLTAYKLLPGNYKGIMKKYENRGKEGLP